jgi:hypothetical protein
MTQQVKLRLGLAMPLALLLFADRQRQHRCVLVDDKIVHSHDVTIAELQRVVVHVLMPDVELA